jgi:threonine-phosphate decarboxylase
MGTINRQHGGNLFKASQEYKRSQFLDFSANINPLGPPTSVLKAVEKNLAPLIANYPDPDCVQLKTVLAHYLEVRKEHILVGNGASELIFLLLKDLLPKKVFIPVPTFSEYTNAALASKAKIVQVPLKGEDFSILNDDFLAEAGKGDLVIICNPNNPTGQLFSKSALAKILTKAHERGFYVLLDESFMDFVENKPQFSFVEELDKHPQLFILYSLTKFFALPGLRIGVLLGESQKIAELEGVKDPWNVNALAQIAGTVALQDREYMDKTFHYIQKAKKILYNDLQKIPGLKPFYPRANYIFCKLTNGSTSTELVQYLGKRGILVRNCNTYPLLGESYIRIAVKSLEHNEELIRNLMTWSQEMGGKHA